MALAIRRLDLDEFDEALVEKAQALATLVLHEDHSIEVALVSEYMPEFERESDAEYFEFRLLNGTGMERSVSLGDNHVPFLPGGIGTEKPLFENYGLPDGRKGRMVQILLDTGKADLKEYDGSLKNSKAVGRLDDDKRFVVLGLAHGREEVDDLLLRIYIALASVDALLLGMIALVVQRALNKGFAPLTAMNAQILDMRPDALERRIHLPATPVELRPVLSALNSFIEKLQAAFIRERCFTSDVAHELRTPIAEFRVACDVGAKWSDDPELVRKRFENLRDSAINMERKVNSLLELSRLDQGTVVVHKSITSVSELVESCWARLCEDKALPIGRLENNIDRSITVDTDAVKLDMIIYNFINNAVSYSLPDSVVTCAGEISADGNCAIRISNQTEDLTADDLKNMFKRFWRGDLSRTDGRHSGLGLSIVKALADVLDIHIKVDLTEEGVFTASMVLIQEQPQS